MKPSKATAQDAKTVRIREAAADPRKPAKGEEGGRTGRREAKRVQNRKKKKEEEERKRMERVTASQVLACWPKASNSR
jgi:hypothetical protein